MVISTALSIMNKCQEGRRKTESSSLSLQGILVSVTGFPNGPSFSSSSFYSSSVATLFVTSTTGRSFIIVMHSFIPPTPGLILWRRPSPQKDHSCGLLCEGRWWCGWFWVVKSGRWWVRYDKFVKFLLGHKKQSFHPVTLSDKSPAIIKWEPCEYIYILWLFQSW